MAYDIVKILTNEVQIQDTSTGTAVKQLAETATIVLSSRFEGVEITDVNGEQFNIDYNLVSNIQVLPAAAIPFTGTVKDLYETLETNFFTNLLNPSTGGGSTPVVNSNITEITTSTYAVTATDYILYCSISTTIILPAPPNIGRVLIINANGFKIQINAGGGDTILGRTTQTLQDYSTIVLQYTYTNNWLAQ